nr:hypothetical protein CFP56_12326 [Quercus suber]
MTSSPRPELHGVRFASHNDEIEPDQSLQPIQDLTGLGDRQRDDLNPEAEQELQQLKTTLQNNIQSSRAQHHAFEPMSLPGSQPASRVSIPWRSYVSDEEALLNPSARYIPARARPTGG